VAPLSVHQLISELKVGAPPSSLRCLERQGGEFPVHCPTSERCILFFVSSTGSRTWRFPTPSTSPSGGRRMAHSKFRVLLAKFRVGMLQADPTVNPLS
jgi:hypothetical protein